MFLPMLFQGRKFELSLHFIYNSFSRHLTTSTIASGATLRKQSTNLISGTTAALMMEFIGNSQQVKVLDRQGLSLYLVKQEKTLKQSSSFLTGPKPIDLRKKELAAYLGNSKFYLNTDCMRELISCIYNKGKEKRATTFLSKRPTGLLWTL
eukprot:IDg11061t1